MSVRISAPGQYLTTDVSLPAVGISGHTVVGWVYLSAARSYYSTICRLAIDSSSHVALETDTDGVSPWCFSSGGSLSSTRDLVEGAWSRVAVTITTGRAGTLYVAAETGAATLTAGTTGNTGAPTHVTLGGRPDDSSDHLDGRLAQWRIWTAVLTEEEIEAEWASPTPVRSTDLFADWPLTSTSDLTDHSGNGNDLAPVGAGASTEGDPPNAAAVDGSLAATVPLPGGVLTGQVKDSAAVASSVPVPSGVFAGDVRASGSLASQTPLPAGAVGGAVRDPGDLTAALPVPAAALGSTSSNAGVLGAPLSLPAGGLAGTVRASAVLAAALPPPVAALHGPLPVGPPLPLRPGLPVALPRLAADGPVDLAPRLRAGTLTLEH